MVAIHKALCLGAAGGLRLIGQSLPLRSSSARDQPPEHKAELPPLKGGIQSPGQAKASGEQWRGGGVFLFGLQE